MGIAKPLAVDWKYGELMDRSVREAMAFGKLDVEFRVTWPDGSIHWVATQGRVLYDASGEPISMAGVVMEVTEPFAIPLKSRFHTLPRCFKRIS